MSADPFHFATGAQVLALEFRRATAEQPAHLDLTLRPREGGERQLRFLNPQDVQLGSPFPEVGWLQVESVRDRQLDGLGVRVSDGEMSESLHFWAERVIELKPLAV